MLRHSWLIALITAAALSACGGDSTTDTGGADSNANTTVDTTASGGGDTTSSDDAAGPADDAGTTPDPADDAGTAPDPADDAGTTPDPADDAGTTPDPETPTDPWADGCPDEVFLNMTHPWVGAGDAYADLTLSVSCDQDAGTMTVTSNGIPHYSYLSMTPNALVEANHNWTVPLNPEIAATPTDIPLLGDAGFGVNGSVWYGPNEGPFPDPYGDPVANGIMDWCGGHTANAYHFHYMTETMLIDWDGDGEPACMDTEDLDESGASYVVGAQVSPIVGFALDGFPIYGPYGCLDGDCTEVVEFHSSWQNTGYWPGTLGCESTADCGNPGDGVCDGPMSTTFDAYQCSTCALANIDGTMTTACLPTTEAWDNHSYVATEGDSWLDECNGRIGPDGTYRYHATATFPYILGCYKGTPTTGEAGGGPQGGGDGDGGAPDGAPQSCTTDADCADACPETVLGCTCNNSPNGLICVPICGSTADCPTGLNCDTAAGICIPEGGPPGG